jgi:adenylate kinase
MGKSKEKFMEERAIQEARAQMITAAYNQFQRERAERLLKMQHEAELRQTLIDQQLEMLKLQAEMLDLFNKAKAALADIENMKTDQ